MTSDVKRRKRKLLLGGLSFLMQIWRSSSSRRFGREGICSLKDMESWPVLGAYNVGGTIRAECQNLKDNFFTALSH